MGTTSGARAKRAMPWLKSMYGAAVGSNRSLRHSIYHVAPEYERISRSKTGLGRKHTREQ